MRKVNKTLEETEEVEVEEDWEFLTEDEMKEANWTENLASNSILYYTTTAAAAATATATTTTTTTTTATATATATPAIFYSTTTFAIVLYVVAMCGC